MNSDRFLHRLMLVVPACFLFIGCSRPSETTRDNRRLFDAILTAVIIKNPKELSKDKELLEQRRKDGKLSQTTCDSIQGLISTAEKGEWDAAEKGLYELRKKQPFPK